MKKIGFRITACIMAVSLLLTLIGCTKDTNETAEVSETLIGQIQSLDGNAVTLLLGDLIEFDETERLFDNPRDRRTEDYITGRFG